MLSPLNDFFCSHFLAVPLFQPPDFIFCWHRLNRVVLFVSVISYFNHFIWFWVLVGLDFCPFQVDSSPPPFGKGALAY